MTTIMDAPVLDQAVFDHIVLSAEEPVLVLFGDGWPPSRAMEVALEELQPRYAGRAGIARVDAKQSRELAERYGITCLPTILVCVRGHVVRRFLGTAMSFELEWALQEVLLAEAKASPGR